MSTVDPEAPPKTPISPKVIASTAAALLIPAALAMLGYLQTDEGRTVFSSWPPIAVVGIMALLPTVAVFLAGYLKADPLRYHPTPEPLPPTEDDPKTAGGITYGH